MKTISDLPEDITEEILSRLPMKFMRAVRLTCKNWNTLTKSEKFSKIQIDKEEAVAKEGESQMIVMMNGELCLMSVVINGDPYLELKGKLTSLTEQLKVSQVFNCEGLLLCIFKNDDGTTNLMVWNPYCFQAKWFEPRCFDSRILGNYPSFYGLGYVEKKIENKTCGRSHKILRFIDFSLLYYATKKQYFWYEIYDFESDSWTAFDVTPLWSIMFHDVGITVKGNTYWCVTKVTDNGIHIICFDFTTERFGSVICLPFTAVEISDLTLSCVREEKLAALLDLHEQNEFEIWITTEITPETVSWSKFLTVNMGHAISCTLESFIIDEEKKLIIGFDDNITIIGESGYFKELDLFEECKDAYYRRYLCAYVPSLVQMKEDAEDKRKEQDTSDEALNLSDLFGRVL